MLHISILRRGVPYRSIDVATAPDFRTREPYVEVSQANAGLIRRDLLNAEQSRSALVAHSTADLVRMCSHAGEFFLNDILPLGDSAQTPQDYVRQVSATTGLPWVMVRRNMEKIHGVLTNVRSVLDGLTRGLDPQILDRGFGQSDGHAVSFFPRADSLGVVLPSNSPGVHALWVPSIALKTPLVLKPGSGEPWTPYRVIQAFMKAGVPPEAFCYYPADHAGASEILRQCGRSMLFGDVGAAKAFRNDPRIEVHGPGYSKIVIGEDCVDQWEKYLDVIVASIVENSGRSCVNASGVWVPRHGRAIAEALAARLAKVQPLSPEDDRAQIAPFADPGVARRISESIDAQLQEKGAADITAKHRRGDRFLVWDGCAYLLPTIVYCNSADHPLANKEFLFPFASVVETSQQVLPRAMGPTLVVTAITEDVAFQRRLLESPELGRLNFGAIQTNSISWDQPHEGNLFDHLFGRRAFRQCTDRSPF